MKGSVTKRMPTFDRESTAMEGADKNPMKGDKKMNMKKKLVAATAMMLISALMLTSVSFAWVTLSTNPEVKGITATAAANGNLEIALNDSLTMSAPVNDVNLTSPDVNVTNNMYVYGNLVHFDGTNAVLDTVKLRQAAFAARTPSGPVTTSAAGNSYLKTYSYGADGRKNSLDVVLKDDAYSTTSKHEGYSMVKGTLNGVEENYAVRFDYWLRANVTGNLKLSAATDRDSSQTTWDGSGSFITIPSTLRASDSTPVKVAFVITDYGTAGTTAGTTTVKSGTDITYTESDTANTFNLTGTLLGADAMVEDHHYLVQMYVYLDGDMVTNAMLNAADTTGISVNVQFANDSVANPMQ